MPGTTVGDGIARRLSEEVAGRLARLGALHRAFVVEETASALRHDLRNKLGAVRNASFYLERRVQKQAEALWSQDPRVPQFFELIREQLGAAEAALVSKLPAPGDPTGARQSLGQGAATPGVCDVRALVQGLTGAPPQAPWLVAAEPGELELAICCLVDNALDAIGASEGAGGAVEVRCVDVRCFDSGGDCVVEVVDDGPGISPEAAGKVMEPFFTTRPGRLGLGLNIARRVAHRAGGSLVIGVIRPEGRGVTAALRLPAAGSR